MNWRDELKVGDTVIEGSGRQYTPDSISTVERITKTQIVLDRGSKFYKESGRLVGADAWSGRHIHQATVGKVHDLKLEREKLNSVSLCKNTNWSAMSVESLRTMIGIVKTET